MVFEVWMQTSVDIIFASISIQRGCAKAAAAFVIICTKLKKNRVLIFFKQLAVFVVVANTI